MASNTPPSISFWRWFFRGTGGKAGLRRLINAWLLFHLAIGGGGLARLITVISDCCKRRFVSPGWSSGWPIFCMGWKRQALLQATEIEKLAEKHEGDLLITPSVPSCYPVCSADTRPLGHRGITDLRQSLADRGSASHLFRGEDPALYLVESYGPRVLACCARRTSDVAESLFREAAVTR